MTNLDIIQRGLYTIWDELTELDFYILEDTAINTKCSPQMEKLVEFIRHSDEIKELREKFLEEYNKMRFIEVE